MRFPDQETRDELAVDVVCAIGNTTFALEHTGIEPFDGLMDLDGRDATHFKPIRDRLALLLPQTEHFVIHLQAKAALGLRRRQLAKLQDRIVEWAVDLAPTLPIARLDAYWTDTAYPPVPGIPFPIALHRVHRGGAPGTVHMVHLVDRDLETDRLARIKRAYEDKMRKLRVWAGPNMRSILILEENDVFMTNSTLVANALGSIEAEAPERPNEVYLLSSAVSQPWYLLALRVGDIEAEDLSIHGGALDEIDPSSLVNITGRT